MPYLLTNDNEERMWVYIYPCPIAPMTFADPKSVEIVESVKDIGVFIDSSFKPSLQCKAAYVRSRATLLMIRNASISNLATSVLGHGASSLGLRRRGIVSLSLERRQAGKTDSAASDEMCGEFQKATVSRTPPRTQTSLDGATLSFFTSYY